jgi:hypothetical protein
LFSGESIEDCLKDFPDYRDELEPLLDISVGAKKAMASLEARPEFKAGLRYKVNSSLNTHAIPGRSMFKWRSQWVTMAISFILVLLLSGGGVVSASGSSMPDSPLYSVKLASEQARLFFTFSDEGKAELYTRLVDERVFEIVNMASENNAEAIKKATDVMRDQLSMLATVSGRVPLIRSNTEEVNKTIATIVGGGGQDTGIKTDTTFTTEQARSDTTIGIDGSKCVPPFVIPSSIISISINGYDGFVETLNNSSLNNWNFLNEALENASGDILEALLEAIEVLEAGYCTTINNISGY